VSPAGVYLSAHDHHGTEAMAGSGSFEEFYTGAVGRLLGQLFPVTGDLHEAEEVVQEAFTRAAARWSRLRDYDVPEAWVRRVAMNLAVDRARSLRRQTRAMVQLRPPPEVPGASDEALALVEALRTLPIRQRQVLVLHYLVDLPVEQVAHTLRMPEGTVKSLLSRGRQLLAAKLGEAEEVLYP
jgi:RNA polymerase sigma-70 factor, ECF subfamily